MTYRQERYKITVSFLVDVAPIVHESLKDVPVTVSVPKGALTVSVGNGPTPTHSKVEIRWEFNDLFTEDAEQDVTKSRIDQCNTFGLIFVPKGNGKFEDDLVVGGETIFDAALPHFARLALAGRSPNFWKQVRYRTLDDAQMGGEVAGHQIKIRAQRAWGVLDVRPSLVEARHFAVAQPFPRYGHYLLTADQRFSQGETADAVVHLAQGMEVAAYDFGRRFGVTSQFKVPIYLGPEGKDMRDPRLWAYNPTIPIGYPHLCELFGARHEWVHEGRPQVRLFDDTSQNVNKNNVRPLKREDYYTFRSAVSSALEWMGELPIE